MFYTPQNLADLKKRLEACIKSYDSKNTFIESAIVRQIKAFYQKWFSSAVIDETKYGECLYDFWASLPLSDKSLMASIPVEFKDLINHEDIVVNYYFVAALTDSSFAENKKNLFYAWLNVLRKGNNEEDQKISLGRIHALYQLARYGLFNYKILATQIQSDSSSNIELLLHLINAEQISAVDLQKKLDKAMGVAFSEDVKVTQKNQDETKLPPLRQISEFVNLNTALGPKKTGHLYQDSNQQEYIIKNTAIWNYPGGNILERIGNKKIVFEKLAFDLYALCGVTVPASLLISKPAIKETDRKTFPISIGWNSKFCYKSDEKYAGNELYINVEGQDMRETLEAPHLCIASSKIKGKTLGELLQINEADVNNEKYLAVFKTQKLNGKPIKGLFENLAVFCFLFDWDGLGHAYNNFLLVEQSDYYQAVKIDPGEACLLSRPQGAPPIETNGFTPLEQQGSTILAEFTMAYGKDNWHFDKVFQYATYGQKLDGLCRVIELTDQQIENCVEKFAQTYLLTITEWKITLVPTYNSTLETHSEDTQLLSEEERRQIIDEIKRRRDLFAKVYQDDLKEYKQLKKYIDKPYSDFWKMHKSFVANKIMESLNGNNKEPFTEFELSFLENMNLKKIKQALGEMKLIQQLPNEQVLVNQLQTQSQ